MSQQLLTTVVLVLVIGSRTSDACRCIRPQVIDAVTAALHATTAAAGKVTMLPFSVRSGATSGKLSVRIPETIAHCSCSGQAPYLRYQFTITDAVGTIGRSRHQSNPANGKCFAGADTLRIAPGPNPKYTLHVELRGPDFPFFGSTSEFWEDQLQVGQWSSWSKAYSSGCSFLYTSTIIDLEDAFEGWLDEIQRRLRQLPADTVNGNVRGSSSKEIRHSDESSQED